MPGGGWSSMAVASVSCNALILSFNVSGSVRSVEIASRECTFIEFGLSSNAIDSASTVGKLLAGMTPKH